MTLGREARHQRGDGAHPQHPVQPLDLPGFLLRQKEREAVGRPHAGHTLTHGCHGWALHQGVILIWVQPLGHQGEVQRLQQDLGQGWRQRGPWQPEAGGLAPHTLVTLSGSQQRNEARKLEPLERSHMTDTLGGKLAPTHPDTPMAPATRSRLSPWARGAHQAGSSRFRRPSTSPGKADRWSAVAQRSGRLSWDLGTHLSWGAWPVRAVPKSGLGWAGPCPPGSAAPRAGSSHQGRCT